MAAIGAGLNRDVDRSLHPRPALAAPPHSIEFRPLASGAPGIFQSLDAMVAATLGRIPPDFSGFDDPHIKRAAMDVCAGTVANDGAAQIAALFDYVARGLEYKLHPPNQQTLQDCRRTLEIGAGDCVSKSVCLATMLAALGHTTRFVAQCDGQEFMHVYVEVLTPGGWLALDPVASDQPMGWSQPLPDGGFETTWEIFRHG